MKRIILSFLLCSLLVFSSLVHAITGNPTPSPIMAVKGLNSTSNWITISNNSTTSSLNNATDFGPVSTSITTQFRIYNNGGEDLQLTGTPTIQISDSVNFTITTFPNTARIFSASSVDFSIQYTPTSSNKDTATVTIPNNDTTKNPFKFIITGSGVTSSYTINTIVWNDMNENGLIDSDEKGLENIIVNLFDGEEKIAKHYTNKQGICFFNSLQEKNYSVRINVETLPMDAVCTTGGLVKNVNLGPNNGLATIDFGFIGDLVNSESDDPVIPEPEEPVLPGNTLVIVPESGTETCILGKCQTSWENLVDQDFDGWDGTVVAKAPQDGSDPQVIMEFADNGIYKFNYVQFQTDNGSDDNHVKDIIQADEIELYVSTTDQLAENFSSIGKFKCTYGRSKMQWFRLPEYIAAKYIKLVITKPITNNLGKQIVEFAVNSDAKNGAVLADDANHQVVQIPQQSKLLPSYPNPFNPTITIPFVMQTKEHVNLTIYDLTGRVVAELANEVMDSGKHQVNWNGKNFSSGIYFVHMQTSTMTQNQSIILLK